MSFLLFAYEKLRLKRKISDLQYKQIVLAQKIENAQDQQSAYNQAISSAKNIVNVFTMSQMSGLNSSYSAAGSAADPTKMAQDMAAKQYGIMATSNLANSIFETAAQVPLQVNHMMEKELEAEQTNIESQLKLMQAKLTEVEKQEDNAAKQAAPKFGGQG